MGDKSRKDYVEDFNIESDKNCIALAKTIHSKDMKKHKFYI